MATEERLPTDPQPSNGSSSAIFMPAADSPQMDKEDSADQIQLWDEAFARWISTQSRSWMPGSASVFEFEEPISSNAKPPSGELRVAAAKHNSKFARLYQFPDELLCLILANLSPSAAACFGLTCHRFRRLSSRYTQPRNTMPSSEAAELSKLLVKDMYCASCATVFSGLNLIPEDSCASHFCSHCKRKHDAAIFSQRQLEEPPEGRLCVGQEGHVRLCAHKTFKFSQFSSSPNTPNTPVWTFRDRSTLATMQCTHMDHAEGIQCVSVETAPYLFPQAVWFSTKHIEITSMSIIFRCKAESKTTKAKLQAALQRWGQATTTHICPHLSWDSPALADLFDSIDCSHVDLYQSPHSGLKVLPRHCDTKASRCYTPPKHKRFCRHCNTSVDFFRSPGRTSDIHEVAMLVQRKISVVDPTSWSWLCALERDSYEPSQEGRHTLWCEDHDCRLHESISECRKPKKFLPKDNLRVRVR